MKLNAQTQAAALGIALLPLAATAQSAAAQAYTPQTTSCPSGFALYRDAGNAGNQTISSSESAYVQSRKSNVLPGAWKTYLANVQGTSAGSSLPSYVSEILNGTGSAQDLPTLGIASSGGGYRAAFFGAGTLNALDARNSSSASAGLGGLLQSATYIAGLSGGSWLLSSLVQANFPMIQELVFGPTQNTSNTQNSWGGWMADMGLSEPSDSLLTNGEYIDGLLNEFKGKQSAGWPVTFVDLWARTLARHFSNGTTMNSFYDENLPHGAGILWSDVVNTPAFASYNIPFPIVVVDMHAPNENDSNVITLDTEPITNTVFEFNPYEMGSFDPNLAAFTQTKYLGTTNTSVCVTGYDQQAFVTGSSSALFNSFNSQALSSTLGPLLQAIEGVIGNPDDLLYAAYPNPFYGVTTGGFLGSNQTVLTLVDGGEDGENLPIQPLFVKARGVDVIISIDATADINNYAAGSALIATQNRTSLFPSAYSFPPVPTSIQTFASQNLADRPTFFGCNTTSSNDTTPLIIYIANGGPPAGASSTSDGITNTATLQLSYNDTFAQSFIDQTFAIATQGRPSSGGDTKDGEWPACVACAVVDRARGRAGQERSGVCQSCFERYCWSGVELDATGPGTGGQSSGAVGAVRPGLLGAVVGGVVVGLGAMLML
ncbi:hypothetical protein CONPUDRAFT_111484 [Coniophora puteana RWD-64-598 SS2]|uniref:Lysophospholipase n=1 Tax=Coniophora puteana (strain RWD-64-598) TaxID=741705 RepID=A0A5M3MCD0_CONPW|nr:uncharacterized protein CONPUDRAFT_111484 [Coniophora puteana RWD-64-598 SS2]EIW76500.1 hypothetical protein CONPUDRAFT_111484 [Coniophora puteana RWD-64-598 SS2]